MKKLNRYTQEDRTQELLDNYDQFARIYLDIKKSYLKPHYYKELSEILLNKGEDIIEIQKKYCCTRAIAERLIFSVKLDKHYKHNNFRFWSSFYILSLFCVSSIGFGFYLNVGIGIMIFIVWLLLYPILLAIIHHLFSDSGYGGIPI